MRKYHLLLFLLFCFSILNAQSYENDRKGNPLKYRGTILSHSFQTQNDHTLPENGAIYYQLNSKPFLSTATKNGRLQGDWQSWYQNGVPCDSGKFVKGLPDGVWKHWDEDGQLVALRTYSADKFQRINNEMLRYNPRRVTYPLATLYQGNRSEALAYMNVWYSFPNAEKKITRFPLTERVAQNITKGKVYVPVFYHALHHGLFMNFYPGNVIRDSGYYKNGLRQGIWLHANIEKGQMQRGTYNNGIKVNEWKTYDGSGKLQELVVYTTKGEIKKTKYFQ